MKTKCPSCKSDEGVLFRGLRNTGKEYQNAYECSRCSEVWTEPINIEQIKDFNE